MPAVSTPVRKLRTRAMRISSLRHEWQPMIHSHWWLAEVKCWLLKLRLLLRVSCAA